MSSRKEDKGKGKAKDKSGDYGWQGKTPNLHLSPDHTAILNLDARQWPGTKTGQGQDLQLTGVESFSSSRRVEIFVQER
jgi:hypothetical protein